MRSSNEILDAAYKEHWPSTLVAMFSGGHDSVCATHVAMRWAEQNDVSAFVCHINTGVGIEQTRGYVESICQHFGWPLKVYHPPVSYQQIVLENGFPGPGAHMHMYRRLKERPVRQIVREHKTHFKDRIMLVTGVRTQESVRRMAHVDMVQREGAQLWVAPIFDWSHDDKHEYMKAHKIPENDVVKILHMSGECLCGAFAKPGERDFIRSMFPNEPVNQQIDDLESKLREAGVTQVWGERPRKEHGLSNLCAHCDKWEEGERAGSAEF